MDFLNSTWFFFIMAAAGLLVLAFSICMHRNNYKYEHLASTSSYWASIAATLVVCIPILVAWTWGSLPNAVWVHVHEIEPQIRAIFPTLVSLLVTFVGLFVTFAILQPRIKIANTVAFIPKSKRLVFNVKNNGLFKVQNLKPELYICTFQKNKVFEPVQLDLKSISSLDWRFAHADLCCMDLATLQDESERLIKLLNEMNDSNCLELRVSSTHIISGKSTTEIKTFYKNDILTGKFKKDTLYAIDGSDNEIKKLHNTQDYIDIAHVIFAYAETILVILLLLLLGWMVGGQYSQYRDCYVCSAKFLSLCLYVITLVQFGTNIQVESSGNLDWTYLKFIKPITKKEVNKTNLLDIMVAILQLLNKKYKQFKSLRS